MSTVASEIKLKYSSVKREDIEVSYLYPDGHLLLEEDPEGWIQSNPTDCLSVRLLELYCLNKKKIGNSIVKLSQLTHLYFYDCHTELRANLNDMESLTHLSLDLCEDNKCLPNSLAKLSKLTTLHIFGCESLTELPANLGDMESLIDLSLDFCIAIKGLPNSLAKLSKLTTFHISRCVSLTKLPANLGDMESLIDLSLDYCRAIKCLPNSLAKLSKLTTLHISGCESLTELPANLGDMESLIDLSLDYCRAIKCLPNSLAKLSKLTTLHISRCESLTEFPANLGDMESLIDLSLDYCRAIKCLPNSLAKLSKLTTLHISGCESLTELPANLGDMESLTHLSLDYCRAIKCLPNSLAKLSKLTTLHISGCESLTELPANLGDMESLIDLSLDYCRAIKCLPNSLAKLSKLTTLHISQCLSLTKLPANLGDMESLTHLSLDWCEAIKCLPNNLAKLSKLTSLHILGCLSLAELSGNMGDMESLTHLSLDSCKAIKGLPNSLAKISKLTTLRISGCNSLAELPASLNVVNLEISYCKSIICLPKGQSHLQTLDLEDVIISIKDQLPELMLVNIKSTPTRCLHWSFTKLPKLRVLCLPKDFILETLPDDLNDSIIISVEGKHVRKTWKELKTEIGHRCEGKNRGMLKIDAENVYFISPPSYLECDHSVWGLGPWIQHYNDSLKFVKFLDFGFFDCVDSVIDFVEDLTELTHLYIFDAEILELLPKTVMRITHLSIRRFSSVDLSLIQGKLPNLKYLDLDFEFGEREVALSVSDSLRYLTLRYCVPFGVSWAKLSNLETLELNNIRYPVSLPANLSLTRVKLINTDFNSLPTGLRHLEILHNCCEDCGFHEVLNEGLKQLVSLQSLSLTCRKIKMLPSVAALHCLRTLQLKDCFALKELPLNLDDVVELCTLNISGTRIKTLPDSIMNLPTLQHVILPKGFIMGSLILKKESIKVSIDDMDDSYYRKRGYYDEEYETSSHASEEGNKITPSGSGDTSHESIKITPAGFVGIIGEVTSKEPEEGINNEQQLSSHLYRNPPDITFHGDSQTSGRNDRHVLENGKNNENLRRERANAECEGKKIDITREDILNLLSRNLSLVAAAEELGVSRSTLKRRWKDLGLGKWPSSRKRNHCTKKRKLSTSPAGHEPITEYLDGVNLQVQSKNISSFIDKSPPEATKEIGKGSVGDCEPCISLSSLVNLAFPPIPVSEEPVIEGLDDANQHSAIDNSISRAPAPLDSSAINNANPDATMGIAKEPPLWNQYHMNALEHGVKECTLSNTVPTNKIPRTFVVKATYNDDTARFDFSLPNTFDQLKEEVGKRLELEVSKFKLKYQDDEKEWVLMTCIPDLENALNLSKSSGSNVVRLSVFAKESAGQQKGPQPPNTYCFPWSHELPECVLAFIRGHTNVKGDGNCGFRSIAVYEYGDEEKWVDVRQELILELTSQKELHVKGLGGGLEEYTRALTMLSWFGGPCGDQHWMEISSLGMVVATRYQKVVTSWSNQECHTFLPLESRFHNNAPPNDYINLGYVFGNHFIVLDMVPVIPLPPLIPLWERNCRTDVRHWPSLFFNGQFSHYRQIRPFNKATSQEVIKLIDR